MTNDLIKCSHINRIKITLSNFNPNKNDLYKNNLYKISITARNIKLSLNNLITLFTKASELREDFRNNC